MKILILVLSCLKAPYKDLLEAQVKTWHSITQSGVDTHFYIAEDYNKMHVPFREVLQEVVLKDYDFIFRTNSCSYVDKRLLKKFCKDLPKEKFYAGVNGGGFASGCGFLMSMDCAKILATELTAETHPYEDVYCGEILQRHGVGVDKRYQRYDFNHADDRLPDVYHYRCKSDDKTRGQDIEAMYKVHKFKLSR